jgi:hypothetical protein
MFLIRDFVDIINVLVDICVLQFVCMISLFENDKEKNQSSVFFLIYASIFLNFISFSVLLKL